MARDKENNPLPSTQRSSGGPFASSGKVLPGDDFFTDSVLENSSIPSPSPQKRPQVKPRRAIGTSKVLQAARNPASRSKPPVLNDGFSRSDRHLQPAPQLSRRKSPSPLRTKGLSTPPRKQSLTTPTDFSSPPGGINDVYERIEAEEDLAATEREGDSEEDDAEDVLQYTSDFDINHPTQTQDMDTDPQSGSHRSGETTPSREVPNDDKENEITDQPQVQSEPATLDFLQNEMTDRVLAAKLTPHVVDRAKDRARLEKLKQSYIPIDFKNGPRINGVKSLGSSYERNIVPGLSKGPISFDAALDSRSNGSSKSTANSTEDPSSRKIQSFSRATKPSNRPFREEDRSREASPVQQRKVIAFSKATRQPRHQIEDQATEEDLPGPIPRLVAFSRAERKSNHARAQSEEPPSHQYEDAKAENTITSVGSEPLPNTTSKTQDSIEASRSFLAKWRQTTAEKRSEKAGSATSDDASQIDWLGVGADVALPSVEDAPTPQDSPPRSAWPASISKPKAFEKSRKWENDFTGLSFQVSDSPPVKSRPQLVDSPREREIERLAKQGVTTSRLGEIQQKDPNVLVRKSSRTFSPEEKRHGPSKPVDGLPAHPDIESETDSETLPDTPVVVSTVSGEDGAQSASSRKLSPASSSSLDHLQRLARAVSTTPKASPPSNEDVEDLIIPNNVVRPSDGVKSELLAAKDTAPASNTDDALASTDLKVAETPRVTGAWTDTILPDTVRPQRQQEQPLSFAQTPHVNAGGWINTPLPSNDLLPPLPIPTTIEEETEDLTNAVLQNEKDNQAVNTKSEDNPPVDGVASTEADESNIDGGMINHRPVQIPKSALSHILDEQRQKRLAIAENPDSKDDTFNLGDATIQSIEEFMIDAADLTADLTSRIRAGARDEVDKLRQEQIGDSENTEVFLASQLTSRMESLMTNLHEARKGISRLEQKVSNTPDELVMSVNNTTQQLSQLCSVCGRDTEPHSHSYASTDSWIPMAYSVAIIPFPLLFYPRRIEHAQRIPRPTPLGWLTIAVWSWFLVERFMCELYAHPLYADYYIWPAEPEPEFPFVLPTMVFRWTRFDKLAPGLWRLVVAFYRAVGMIFGFSDGFVDGPSQPTDILAQATQTAVRAAKSLLPQDGFGTGPDLSMMSDEII